MRHLSVALAAIALAALFSWAAAPAQAAFPGANGRLAFDSAGNIYTVKADGTRLLKLTSDGESSGPAWSPSGKRIAFSRRGFIFVMTAQGRFPRKIERLGHSPSRLGHQPASASSSRTREISGQCALPVVVPSS